MVSKEPQLTLVGSGNLKPDLVIANREGVFVVDVTVRHEDGENLSRARDEKIRKYRGLLPQVQTMFGHTSGEVLPIVVGTRGAMPSDTLKALRRLGLDRRKIFKSISLMALRSSIEIYHGYLDYDHFYNPPVAEAVPL